MEGRGDMPIDKDLLSELEAVVRTLSPSIATLGDGESGEDPVDRLLREAVQAVDAKNLAQGEQLRRIQLRQLPAEAIRALARVLSGPTMQRYRVPSSARPGAFNSLDVDGGDVVCDCRGFEYRGACTHARALKKALASGSPLPEGFALVNDV